MGISTNALQEEAVKTMGSYLGNTNYQEVLENVRSEVLKRLFERSLELYKLGGFLRK